MFTPLSHLTNASDLSYLYSAISSLRSPLSIFSRGSTSSYLVHILIITLPLGKPCFLSRPWELWAEENHCFTFHTSNAKTMTDVQESVLYVSLHVWVCTHFKLLTSVNHRTGKLFLPCESTVIPSRNKKELSGSAWDRDTHPWMRGWRTWVMIIKLLHCQRRIYDRKKAECH